jgi:hypothetical protein
MNWFGIMAFNATFNNISAISWRSVLLVKETGEKSQTGGKSLTSFIFIYCRHTNSFTFVV